MASWGSSRCPGGLPGSPFSPPALVPSLVSLAEACNGPGPESAEGGVSCHLVATSHISLGRSRAGSDSPVILHSLQWLPPGGDGRMSTTALAHGSIRWRAACWTTEARPGRSPRVRMQSWPWRVCLDLELAALGRAQRLLESRVARPELKLGTPALTEQHLGGGGLWPGAAEGGGHHLLAPLLP